MATRNALKQVDNHNQGRQLKRLGVTPAEASPPATDGWVADFDAAAPSTILPPDAAQPAASQLASVRTKSRATAPKRSSPLRQQNPAQRLGSPQARHFCMGACLNSYSLLKSFGTPAAGVL